MAVRPRCSRSNTLETAGRPALKAPKPVPPGGPRPHLGLALAVCDNPRVTPEATDQPENHRAARQPTAPAGERSHYRVDALSGRITVIAGQRQGRPDRPTSDCPFCVGGRESPSPYDTRSFTNRWPTLIDRRGSFDTSLPGTPTVPATGTCEVVLYSPDHEATMASLPPEHIAKIVDLWAERSAELRRNADTGHVLIFENSGADVGATIEHPHGQIFAFADEPPAMRVERERSADQCAVCVELGAEALTTDSAEARRVVLDNGTWVAFVPEAAGYPFELRLSCKAHVVHLDALGRDERSDLAQMLGQIAGVYASLFDTPMPYMMWIHQGVHTHLHFVPTWRRERVPRYVAAGELGSDLLINPISPEDAAHALRLAATETG